MRAFVISREASFWPSDWRRSLSQNRGRVRLHGGSLASSIVGTCFLYGRDLFPLWSELASSMVATCFFVAERLAWCVAAVCMAAVSKQSRSELGFV